MVVGYINVIGISVFPTKTDSPLIINPYAVLALAVALQDLETVAGRDPEVLKMLRLVKVQ